VHASGPRQNRALLNAKAFGTKEWTVNTAAMDDFLQYVKKQIEPAVADVGNLPDASRKHVQRLIYTNLVDRFDVMVDTAILQNCRCEHLASQATGNMTQNITEADLLRLLMNTANMQDAVDERLKLALRGSVLRERHSKKLAVLFAASGTTANVHNQPRVNISTGRIIATIKPQRKDVPYSICGYADWLYARRNSVVHGGGTARFLENDRTQIDKLYKVKVAKSHKILLASTTIAAAFYADVVEMLKQ
jgi:hypothetical protein